MRDVVNVRRSQGKRPFDDANPEVWPALEKLVDPVTRGEPESPLRWTCKSTHALSAELFSRHGIRISDKTVAKSLREHGYSLQAPNKSVEGARHPDRNAQFEHINAKAQRCIERGVPVISVDTKKKELVGNFKNGGRVSGNLPASPSWWTYTTSQAMLELNIERADFHGDWNYVVRPRK